MKTVSILVPNEAVMASIVDPRTIFTGANDFLQAAGRQPMFHIQFVGLSREVSFHNGLFTVKTDALIDEVKQTDLIIIPAISGNIEESLEANKAFIPWIIERYNKGSEVASMCIGAFLLASTGLLNGKECSSHWLTADKFREMFPEVTLVDGRIVTEQQGLYSSGGATSYFNLLLYLVEKYAGREIAITASKIFALEIDRKSQSPFVMFNGQKSHDDEPIKMAQEFIEKNITEKISIDELADKFAIGRRHFDRRFKKATNNTAGEYIQRVKIEAAKKQLESTTKNVNEVMYDVGYSDAKTFRTLFKKLTGLSPIEYRNKYNKSAAALVASGRELATYPLTAALPATPAN
jgi:transcriptional regulator GlxA family with amidase domain